jgi:hypothetical protein
LLRSLFKAFIIRPDMKMNAYISNTNNKKTGIVE